MELWQAVVVTGALLVTLAAGALLIVSASFDWMKTFWACVAWFGVIVAGTLIAAVYGIWSSVSW